MYEVFWPPREEPVTLAAKARLAIERRIGELALIPGTVVTERELAEALGFGKAPVREALQRLSTASLLSPRTGSGYYVAPITLGAARSLFEIWRVTEPEALTAAWHRNPEVTVKLLETVFAEGIEWPESIDTGPPDETYLFHELMTHWAVMAISHNRWFVELFGMAFTELERLLRFVHRLGGNLAPLADHEAMVTAVRAGDVDAFRRASVDHLERLERAVFEVLLNSDVALDVNLAAAVSGSPADERRQGPPPAGSRTPAAPPNDTAAVQAANRTGSMGADRRPGPPDHLRASW